MNDNSRPRLWRALLLSSAVLLLCACMSTMAFLIGRQSAILAAPAPEIIEEEVVEQNPIEPTSLPTETALPTNTPTPEIEPTRTPMAPLDREFNLEEGDLDLFYEVWQIISEQYDGELPDENELLYSTIRGSLDSLDDEFTRYLPPAAAARVREDMQGSFEGIGAYVNMTDDGYLEIVRPIADQPAARAGLQAGDIIIAVDGESILGKSLDDAIALVRGPRGTAVTLTVTREEVEEPFDVTIVRERIEIATVESEMLPEGIAYVRLTSFNSVATQQLSQTLTELLAQNPQALIFDLRDNPGGFLDQAVNVADLFLPDGVVLYERNIRGLDKVFQSKDGGPAENIPLVVLVNVGSASASEIVAGAIQDRGRAILIGETTFGKGSVQQVHTLSDGSELRVTIARWYTPNDNSIDKSGIIPEFEVLPSPVEFRGPEDTQLQRAIEYIQTGE
jgi:carboxyl-terminal processing protease